MERVPKGLYTPEFRAEAVKLVVDSGLSVNEGAKRLLIPKNSLGSRRHAAPGPIVDQEPGKGS